jgi:hypothetical protein
MFIFKPAIVWRLMGVLIVCLTTSWASHPASATNLYVCVPGVATNNAPPFTNWSLSCSNIQWVINSAAAGDTVWVSNGTYYLTNRIDVGKSVTIKGYTNNGTVTVDGGNAFRCFCITDGGATVDCFNIVHGDGIGGGVYMSAGTVQNCIISSNAGAYAAGVYMLDGTMQNCTISYNIASDGQPGGGIYLLGGKLLNCLVCNNTNISSSAFGGGVANKGLVQNCIIVSNSITDSGGYGGGMHCDDNSTSINCLVAYNYCAGQGGGLAHGSGNLAFSIINCTVVSNYAPRGGGWYKKVTSGTGLVANTIIYHNRADTAGESNYLHRWFGANQTTLYYNCCTAPPFSGDYVTNTATNNIFVDPQFVNKDTGDWRLSRESPCVNAGTNEAWMDNSTDLDGRHRRDVFSGQVDMGCYEYLPAGSMYRGF